MYRGFFIDATNEDRDTVARLDAFMAGAGYYCYSVFDIPEGFDWGDEYQDAITNNELLVYVASEKSPFRGWNAPREKRPPDKPIIVFSLQDERKCLDVDGTYKIDRIVRASVYPPNNNDFAKLAQAIFELMGTLPERVPAVNLPGLQSFLLDAKGRSGPLRVFICHSSSDKQWARTIFQLLNKIPGVSPWLDEENLLPGQDWKLEIRKAIKGTDLIIICLSKDSINKRGFVQSEIKYALDVADEQPEGEIFVIPLLLDRCDVPERLKKWQWVNFYDSRNWELLYKTIRLKAENRDRTA